MSDTLLAPCLIQKIDVAYYYWSSGRELNAGRIVYEQIPVKMRPLWAVRILKHCLPLGPTFSEFDDVCALAYETAHWKDAHAAFSAVRQRTLQPQSDHGIDTLSSALFSLVENTAKVIYNASGEPAPFDHDAGYRVVGDARKVVDLVGKPELEEKIWAAIVSLDII